MPKAIESLTGADAIAFETAITPHIEAVLASNGYTPTSEQAAQVAADAVAVAADADQVAADKLAVDAAAGTALAGSLDASIRAANDFANLFDKDSSAVLTNYAVRASDGVAVAGQAGYVVSPFIRVPPSGSISSFGPLFGNGAIYGRAFYTQPNEASFVAGSGQVNNLAAAATLAVPATANYVRVTVAIALLGRTSIVHGAVIPTVYRAFERMDTVKGRKTVNAVRALVADPEGNRHDVSKITDGYYINTTSGALTANASYMTNSFGVDAGDVVYFDYNETGSTGYHWADQNGGVIPGGTITAGTGYTAPEGAVKIVYAFNKNASSLFWGTAASNVSHHQLGGYVGSIPTRRKKGGRLDLNTAADELRKRDLLYRGSSPDLYAASQITAGKLLQQNEVEATSSPYHITPYVPVIDGKPLTVPFDFVPGSASYGWNLYDVAGRRLGTMTGTFTADYTAGSNQFTVTSFSSSTMKSLPIGVPLTAAGYLPTGAYVTAEPAGGGLGVYTFATKAGASTIASATGISSTFGGQLAGVGIYPPTGKGVALARTSLSSGKMYATLFHVAVKSLVDAEAQGVYGAADIERSIGFLGQLIGLYGDSIMADATGGNGYHLGITYLLRAKGAHWQGVSGRKTYQAFDGASGAQLRGPTGTLVQADIAGIKLLLSNLGTNDFGIRNTGAGTTQDPALIFPFKDSAVLGNPGDIWTPTTFTATTTNGATTLTGIGVTRGALQHGAPLRGTNIPLNCTLVDLGGGSWGLSANATGGSATTIQAGTFCADLYDIWIRKGAAWQQANGDTDAQIVLITPLPRFDDIVNAGGGDITKFCGATAGNPMNGRGYSLRDLCEKIIAFGKAYAIPVYDLNANAMLNVYNYPALTTDGLHPSQNGNVKFVKKIARFASAVTMGIWV